DADLVLCMSIHPGYSGQKFMPDAVERIGRLRAGLPEHVYVQVDGGIDAETIGAAHGAGATLLVAGSAVFGREDPGAAYRGLVRAGAGARGATLSVPLDPCSHHGRPPPCADAVVAAGVAGVVVGAHAPTPVVDGGGLERLRAAGIDVELLDDLAARRQNEAWR